MGIDTTPVSFMDADSTITQSGTTRSASTNRLYSVSLSQQAPLSSNSKISEPTSSGPPSSYTIKTHGLNHCQHGAECPTISDYKRLQADINQVFHSKSDQHLVTSNAKAA
ncbi:uncharacterized protein BP01DRAFT_380836 [Aspergillus saccharolyticus JOP 1030-1]|uniref:Uncharacterized protein n=1 Tax=Aspergillus saccharolyticus JOP 1030-1 TaxID=1450539 RepID=A0A318ZTK1_9EURO|nr:hypothetical protein BP01DRAFT_380836 [Aspergillus saccharolyticus JOP 1030-1]PYH47633.1 hypothetical protein BP01DRAFT_380836 [Aspergillus saccharolyticus JOP 1030-1]